MGVGKQGEGKEQELAGGKPAGGKLEILCARLKEEIVRCEAEFEEAKSDAFEGTILKGKLDMLQAQYKCLEKGEEPETLLIRLRERKQELEEAREREEYSSTFDWYDEHYYWKIYDGQVRACVVVIGLLEEYCKGLPET